MSAMIVDDLTLTYDGGGGVRTVSMKAADRAVTAVIGPNGAGKTVLFSILAGLSSPQSGSVRFGKPDARVAFCPDVPQFEPWLSASEVVRASLELTQRAPRRGGARAAERVDAALDACGLTVVAQRRIAAFSRGMLQRLGIAAALVTDPDILILDEPSSALDPVGRADVRALVEVEKTRRCVVLSSHLLSEVEVLADHIVVLDGGTVVGQGTPAELMRAGRKPVWAVRFDAPISESVCEGLTPAPGMRLTRVARDQLILEFATFADAASHLLPVVSEVGVPVLEIAPCGRDLDSFFARLLDGARA
ncbi:ABC transporter ATP-binding protein [Microbacterium hydrothermale]|uniref:ABC transporter ATP-binding protein n=1 Tax=Microbacterium hydrothermale TaxID=857427 RepID=UPI0010A8B48F|nr:ABC transporter ATP-binding protein [Microbacterium hydrothermale]